MNIAFQRVSSTQVEVSGILYCRICTSRCPFLVITQNRGAHKENPPSPTNRFEKNPCKILISKQA